MKSEALLEKLHGLDREYRLLENVAAVLQWDQETYLPIKGVEDRSEQLSLMEGIAHERFTNPEIGRLLQELGSDAKHPDGDETLPSQERDFLKVLRRGYDRAVKLPADLVRDAARAEGLSQAAWVQARKHNDFQAFAPHLSAMIDFARKKAACWGYEGSAVYDGLLDIYEPGLPAAKIDALFGPLRDRLAALLKRIAVRPQIDAPFLKQNYDIAAQARFNQELMDWLGFDKERGRLDITAHPFTTSLGFDDVRITTRYFQNNLLSSVFSTIHESGHAFYEMGLPPAFRGSCLADGASMAVHESQSRFWENVIGRSRPFWEGRFPALKAAFPEQLAGVDAHAFYRAVNRVEPSLIRVDADEVSYGLHIILRFELEKRLFAGTLAVQDLPAAWRKAMKDLIGVEPETDADGVLQDVHWSQGSFGYFPSYALGNLYGLQFTKKLRRDIPDFENAITQGNFRPIYTWLKDTIYIWGRRLDPPALLKQVTGEDLSALPFLDYIESKYTELYGL
ncbi:carboxypeptidase M32 [Spirochaetia bacterium]|nr:carboxypeptidase M32 [Spirochaetia bacterium]